MRQRLKKYSNPLFPIARELSFSDKMHLISGFGRGRPMLRCNTANFGSALLFTQKTERELWASSQSNVGFLMLHSLFVDDEEDGRKEADLVAMNTPKYQLAEIMNSEISSSFERASVLKGLHFVGKMALFSGRNFDDGAYDLGTTFA